MKMWPRAPRCDNGEEISAVKYDGKVYTYKN